jgi:signal transduction histidine kinase
MDQNIFHNASLKLTAMYVSIIMVISLIFSIWLYNISLAEITQSVRRPPGPVEQLLLRENSRFASELRDAQNTRIADARDNLLFQFFVLNAVIAVSGGLGSYYLARRTLEPIEQAHEAQSRFTADASHELRTPIAAMRIENELTLTDPSLDVSTAKKQIESTIEELDKLTALTENMLRMARFDGEQLELTSVAVETIVHDSVDKVKALARQKKQKIILADAPTIHVKTHADSMVDALVVILDNAIKYSPEKSDIRISARVKSKKAIIAVTDSGPGIPVADIPKIFNRFYRSDSSRTKNAQKGFGLGLSIAKSLVQATGGSIAAKNNKPTGAVFSIELPLAQKAQ